MKQVLSILQAGLLLAAIFVCVKVFVVLDHVDKRVFAVTSDIHDLMQDSENTMMALNKASAEVALTSHQQRLYWKVISHDTARTIEASNRLITNTDKSLNQVLIPQLALSLKDSDADLAQITNQSSLAIANLNSGLQPILVSSLQASKNLEALSADPALATTLRNMQQTTLNLQATTEDVRFAVHDLTHPKKQTFAMRMTWLALSKLSQIGQVISGFVK